MKLRSKLLFLNILINTSAMILLGVVLSFIISNYIENDLSEDLRLKNYYETETLEKIMYYEKYDREYAEKELYDLEAEDIFTGMRVHTLIIDLQEGDLLSGPIELHENYTIEEIYSLFNFEEDFYNITLFERPFLAYCNRFENETISGDEYEILICSFVSRHQIIEVRNSILLIVLLVIIAIDALLILLTGYYGKILIHPINLLISVTEKIARKEFNEKAHLNTGDEFEYLGNAINDMSQSLKNRDIEQKKFYETISHDIKTPLTIISGYAQGLKTDIFEEKEKTLDKIVDECQILKTQLENVIFLSKLDTVKEAYKFEQLEINSMIIESLNNVESLIILNEIDVDYSPSKNIFLNGDRQKLKKAFVNILTNCIKYTKDRIAITIEKKGKDISLTISDNGSGFSKELLENAFSRDYVGEKEGTGIGLSIIKKVVEGHKGTLTLSNNRKKGAVYNIKLPV